MVKRFNPDISSPRQSKVAATVHETIAMMILRDEIINIKPFDITVSAVSISPDLRQASIYVVPHESGIGKKARTEAKIMANLTNARNFIRLRISHILSTKICPEIHFYQDIATKNAIEFDVLLTKVSAE
jgi:ribosome-binding factor A